MSNFIYYFRMEKRMLKFDPDFFFLLKKHVDILTIAQCMLNFRPKPVSFEVKHTLSVLRLPPVRLTNNIKLSHANKTLLLRFQRLIFLNIVFNIVLSYFS